MEESRIMLVDRLRAAGQWAAASARKDAIYKELRDKGMPKKQAREEAWRRLAAEYPPVQQPAADDDDFDDDLDDLDDDLSPEEEEQIKRDSDWAYANSNDRHVTAENAPSAGAWEALCDLRSGRTRNVIAAAKAALEKMDSEMVDNLMKRVGPLIADQWRKSLEKNPFFPCSPDEWTAYWTGHAEKPRLEAGIARLIQEFAESLDPPPAVGT
jgi:hypothetical protein